MYLIAGFSLLRMSGVLIFDPTGQFQSCRRWWEISIFIDLLKTLKVVLRYTDSCTSSVNGYHSTFVCVWRLHRNLMSSRKGEHKAWTIPKKFGVKFWPRSRQRPLALSLPSLSPIIFPELAQVSESSFPHVAKRDEMWLRTVRYYLTEVSIRDDDDETFI